MERQASDRGFSFDSDALLCFLALLVSTTVNAVLNGSVYPCVAGYFAVARELSTLFGGAVAFVVYVVATRRPSALEPRLLLVVSLGCAVTSCLVLVSGMAGENAFLTLAGLLFMNVAFIGANASIAMALSRLAPSHSLAAVVFGVAVGMLAAAATPSFSPSVGVVVYVGAFALIVAVLYPCSKAVLESIAREEAPSELELTNPESFPRPASPLFACVLFLGVTMGYGLTFNASSDTYAYSALQGLALLVVALWMALSRNPDKEDQLFSLAALAIIAGLVIASSEQPSGRSAANVLLCIGEGSFSMLLWLVMLSIGRRNPLALLSTFALSRAAASIGIVVGAVLGNITQDVIASDADFPILISGCILFAFIAFLWLAFRRFSFSEVIRGVASLQPTSDRVADEGPAAGSSLEEDGEAQSDNPLGARVAALAEQHGLTARETEVFSLLARGRNGQYIMNSLVISKNTVKSHCARIYAKLGVHSQQELIDLVEAGE